MGQAVAFETTNMPFVFVGKTNKKKVFSLFFSGGFNLHTKIYIIIPLTDKQTQ